MRLSKRASALIVAVSLIPVSAFITNAANATSTDFVTTWNTSTNPTITLPFVDTATDLDFTVDWGDSSTAGPYTQLSGATLTHSYTGSTATRVITISGSKLPGWNLNTVNTSRAFLKEIDQWGGFRFGNQAQGGYFASANGLVTVDATDAPDLTGVTNLSSMFRGAINLVSIVNAASWNTSNVTYMNDMFRDATVFNQNIGSWDTSNVTDMASMFEDAAAFNQNIGNWDTSKVTDMNKMFWSAAAFNQNIGYWDTSEVTNMSRMFSETTLFNNGNSTNIGNWDTSKVTNMSRMFSGATVFNQDLAKWCVSQIASTPASFETGATAWSASKPNWGADCSTTVHLMINYVTPTGRNQSYPWAVASGASTATLPLPSVSSMTFTGWYSKNSLINGQTASAVGTDPNDEVFAGIIPSELAQVLGLP